MPCVLTVVLPLGAAPLRVRRDLIKYYQHPEPNRAFLFLLWAPKPAALVSPSAPG